LNGRELGYLLGRNKHWNKYHIQKQVQGTRKFFGYMHHKGEAVPVRLLRFQSIKRDQYARAASCEWVT
jgi:hypothetical protein